MVHNFNPNSNWYAPHSPENMIAMDSKIYFANESTNGKIALYVSDGTDAGTFPIKNMDIDTRFGMTELNGKLYFQATETDVSNNYEPWVSDGTEAGTYKIKDIKADGGSTSKGTNMLMTAYKNEVYFKASDNVYYTNLWKTDGTEAGTVMVKDIRMLLCCSYDQMIVFKNELYFCAADNLHGYELWKTDGTTAGTVMVADITPSFGYSSTPLHFTIMNNALYFSAEGNGTGRELYKTDGTAAGTVLVKDITPGTADSFNEMTSPFIAYNSELYFNVYDDVNKRSGIYKTDGTTAGTVSVDLSLTLNSSSVIYNGKLYFTAFGESGFWVYVTDGTATGLKPLVDPSVTDFTRRVNTPHDLTIYNGRIYYMAEYTRDYITYEQLMQSDGTSDGTIALTNEKQYSQPGTKYNICVSNGELFFEYNTQLWKLTTTPPVVTTGILNNTAQENTISIYPNPATALATVDFKDIKNVVSLSVYNSAGVLIKQLEVDPAVTSARLDVQDMSNGLFYVILTNASGEQLAKKLIKN